MKRWQTIGVRMAVCWMAGVMTVTAGMVELDGQAEARVASGFTWRGTVITEDPVFQPSVNLNGTHGGVRVWGTWDLTDSDEPVDRSRVDLSVFGRLEAGMALLRGGAVAYLYHDGLYARNQDTYEVFAECTLDVIGLPSVRVNYDISKLDGLYAQARVAHSFELIADQWAMDIRLGVGLMDQAYAETQFTTRDAESGEVVYEPDGMVLSDFEAIIEWPVFIGPWTVTPAVLYQTQLDSDVKDAVKAAGEATDQWVVSLACGYTF